MDIVIDNSVIIKWFFEEDGYEQALALLLKATRGEIKLHAPILAKYEFTNVLKSKKINDSDAKTFIRKFFEAKIIFHNIDSNDTNEIYKISVQENISFYDASYLYISREVGFRFVTADEKLVNNVRNPTYYSIVLLTNLFE